ncbi:rhs repeat-associated core domain protein [Sporocytophaga myxococcoides]|uniref:Rhs repeat-associated core domain protein, partial n=1 Tax=Sporocytophaga myxococcoides TaxID=153721 RepID=A0A098LP21_9BACT|nr:rhs repeat-associated core domain protein [Sporocytophaga myxococcoides]
MEKDDELKGSGNSYDFGARFYDARLGRWMSVDPLASKYPEVSTYCYAANSPISIIDIDGRDIYLFFYSQEDSHSGAGHIAVGVGSETNMQYFSHYPVHDNAPGGAHNVTGLTYDKAKNYDVNAGLQQKPPALVIRIKTSGDVDAETVKKLTESLKLEWSATGQNCADGGKQACTIAGVKHAENELISSPARLADYLLNENADKLKNGTISVVEGDVAKFEDKNINNAIISTTTKSTGNYIKAGYNAVKEGVVETTEAVGDFLGDVKSKTLQGISDFNNWTPH